jgi:hypothetical protein
MDAKYTFFALGKLGLGISMPENGPGSSGIMGYQRGPKWLNCP